MYKKSNFNSHAHVERDSCQIAAKKLSGDISTHTLTWSVTVDYRLWRWRDVYFNSHAHVERDSNPSRLFELLANFNSHAHVERDPLRRKNGVGFYYFNSHAHVERDQAFDD